MSKEVRSICSTYNKLINISVADRQLALQPVTIGKFTKEALFAKFAFDAKAPEGKYKVETSSSSPVQNIHDGGSTLSTPTTSPIKDTAKEQAISNIVATDNRVDSDSDIASDNEDTNMESILQDIRNRKAQEDKDGQANNYKTVSNLPKALTTPVKHIHQALRVQLPADTLEMIKAAKARSAKFVPKANIKTAINSSSEDDDLEILPPGVVGEKTPKTKVTLDNIHVRRKRGSTVPVWKMFTKSPAKLRRKGALTDRELDELLALREREQAAAEKREKQAELVAKGGSLMSLDEKMKEEQIVEDLLERERKNAEDARKKDKRERRRNGEEEEIFDDEEDDDEDEDEEYDIEELAEDEDDNLADDEDEDDEDEEEDEDKEENVGTEIDYTADVVDKSMDSAILSEFFDPTQQPSEETISQKRAHLHTSQPLMNSQRKFASGNENLHPASPTFMTQPTQVDPQTQISNDSPKNRRDPDWPFSPSTVSPASQSRASQLAKARYSSPDRAAFSDDVDGDDVDDVLDPGHISGIEEMRATAQEPANAFAKLLRAQKRKSADIKRLKKSKQLREMFDERAEESEDEWAGVGGKDESESDGDDDEEEQMKDPELLAMVNDAADEQENRDRVQAMFKYVIFGIKKKALASELVLTVFLVPMSLIEMRD